MPFMLEDVLNKNSGGKYTKAAQDWGEKVVVENDGKLITGQNPASGMFFTIFFFSFLFFIFILLRTYASRLHSYRYASALLGTQC